MPLLSKIVHKDDTILAIWTVTEDIDYFRRKITVSEGESKIIQGLKNRKLREWVSSRYLIHLLSGRTVRGYFEKDIHGKPHIIDSSYHLSISHSHDLVAVIASPLVVGIDIQYYVSKISRIAHKFVREDEKIMQNGIDEMVFYHIVWGAKESLYKAYGKRALDFKKHIILKNMHIVDNIGTLKGIVEKDNFYQEYNLHIKLDKKYVLVYAKECN